MDETLKSPLTVPGGISVEEREAPPLTLRDMFLRRFRRHTMAMVGIVTLVLLVIYAFGGALIFPEDYARHNDLDHALEAPSSAHPFGTDSNGRDILARTVYGGQVSLIIGLSAAFLEIVVGVLIGAIAGYYGGIIDSVLMRFAEAMLIIPQIFLLLVMAKFFAGKIPDVTIFGHTSSGSVIVIVVIIGLTSWMYTSRIVRAEFLSIKEREFVLAARATGTRISEIIFGHILPNSIAPIIVSATLGVANAILSEAYISFLGLGVQGTTPTWGNMLEKAYQYIESAYWLWTFPGLLIILTVLSINFVGDGLRDALDPRSRAV